MRIGIVVLLAGAVSAKAAVAGDAPPPRPEALGSRGLSVVAIGDSNTETGNWVQPLAAEMERAFGHFGSGYRGLGGVRPDQLVGNARHPELQPWLRLSATGEWDVHYGEGEFAQFAPDNAARVGKTPGARVRAEFHGRSVRVFHLVGRDLGSMRLLLDGKEVRTVDCKDPSVPDERRYDLRAAELTDLSAGRHALEIEVAAGRVVPLGIDVRSAPSAAASAGPVALVHKWGRSSSTSAHHVQIKAHIHEQALRLLSPDAVVTMLGTNDHNMAGNTSPVVMRNTAELVRRVRSAAPQAGVLILSTLEFNPTPVSAWLLKGYLEDWPRLAGALGVSYWDLHGWMLPRWRDRVYKGEEIHFSPEGGRALAAELFPRLRDLKAGPAPAPGRSAGSPADPASLPVREQILAWFAADGPVELDADARVRAWKSTLPGFGEAAAVQPLAELRPALAADAIAGKPAVRFSGGQFLVMATGWGTRGFAMVWKARKPQGCPLADGRMYYEHFGPGAPGTGKPLDPKRAKAGKWFLDGREVKAEDLGYPLDGPHILVWSGEGFANVDLIGHHRCFDGDSGMKEPRVSFLDADIAELLLRINVDFPDAERVRLEDYWAGKYGIKLNR